MNDKSFVVKPQNQDMSIKTIVDYIERGYALQNLPGMEDIAENERLEYNDCIILKPFYQREYRFTGADESSLVESILVGIPIPPVFLSSTRFRGAQVLDVVDGQHRLTAFYRYRKGDFALNDLQLLNELNGKKFDDLNYEQKEAFISHVIPAYVFRDFPGKKFELEVFNRYNKGTKTLTPQEIRNAVYSSPYNDFVSQFVKSLFEDKKSKLSVAYNVTTDRYLKKKVHEGIFTIWWILERGINTSFKDSTEYADEYMKDRSEFCLSHSQEEVAEELKNREMIFAQFNMWIEDCTDITPYPFSKEIYGISSTSYKFQTSMAMILSALYRKIYLIKACGNPSNEDIMRSIKEQLATSFLEDKDYNASSTNSIQINEFVNKFTIL